MSPPGDSAVQPGLKITARKQIFHSVKYLLCMGNVHDEAGQMLAKPQCLAKDFGNPLYKFTGKINPHVCYPKST